jgi:hypothetical protein
MTDVFFHSLVIHKVPPARHDIKPKKDGAVAAANASLTLVKARRLPSKACLYYILELQPRLTSYHHTGRRYY